MKTVWLHEIHLINEDISIIIQDTSVGTQFIKAPLKWGHLYSGHFCRDPIQYKYVLKHPWNEDTYIQDTFVGTQFNINMY